MRAILRALLDPSGLTPHGFCLLWQPGLIWLHAAADTLIGLAYYSIPLALIHFIRHRRDFAFGWVFWLFAAFILACGTTHFVSVLTLWQPAYWLDGAIKAITALLSVGTAVILWPIVRRALALPSRHALEEINMELARKIADHDRAEAALRASEARLRQSQKMETIGQLTGGVAHDFNNLLTVVLGGLETIERKLGELPSSAAVESIRRADAMAMQAVDRAADLTQRLLAFARRQPLIPRQINANRLVADISEVLRRTLGETVALETVLAGGLWLTMADSNQLETALINLAVNARDAMPDGGKLTIETGNAYLDENYVNDLPEPISAGQYVMIAVTDTGVGMDAATAERAFEPFFTTKAVGRGTGLGLSQVYGFVRQSRGYVRIYSEVGHGTTVKIYLPRLVAAPQFEPASAQQDATPRFAAGEVVLVVEDDDALRAHSTSILRELGYTVLAAANGAEALEIVAAQPRIDVLFTDIVLPGGMSGREVAEAAVSRLPDLKVLFTTGYTQNAVVHNGQLDPGVDLISKPFRYAELAAKLRQVLDGEPLASAD
jgi:signal transduction histidine kinase/CheY-like chemotaxis protein